MQGLNRQAYKVFYYSAGGNSFIQGRELFVLNFVIGQENPRTMMPPIVFGCYSTILASSLGLLVSFLGVMEIIFPYTVETG